MLHRRDAMLRLGQVGLGAITLPRLLAAQEQRSAANSGKKKDARAKACILVYLWGGPPQQDTFDMKPDAPDGIRSQFQPINSVVPGIQVCDQLPQIAKVTDKLAIIRSYTHPSNQHEVGVYHTLTGKINNTLVVPRNQRNRRDFPTMGSVVSYLKPPGDLPTSVTIPRPIGHDGVTYTGTYAGFLGPQHDPLELLAPAEVKERAAHGLELPQGWDAHRLQSRFGLLNTLEEYDRVNQANAQRLNGLGKFREQAFRMLTSPSAKAAFDLNQETDQLRDRYGRNEYGEGFLLARRLVEAGVRLVTLVWYHIAKKDGNVLNVWDNHGGTPSLNSISGYQMLKEPYCFPSLDQGYSALIEDLSQRGQLDETLVAMLGEFGRTPKINKDAGRDHWGACQSVVLAGGGIRGGQIYGASDKTAAYPTDKPVTPEDFIATVYHGLGIAPEAMLFDSQNRPQRASEGEPILSLFS
jgi:hypothetical protein